jgi:hypothetical protein
VTSLEKVHNHHKNQFRLSNASEKRKIVSGIVKERWHLKLIYCRRAVFLQKRNESYPSEVPRTLQLISGKSCESAAHMDLHNVVRPTVEATSDISSILTFLQQNTDTGWTHRMQILAFLAFDEQNLAALFF